MKKFLAHILGAILGLWLMINFLTGVSFTGTSLDLILIGTVLAIFNTFLRPILNFLTLPLRVLTFGLFSLIVNMLIIWLVDSLFVQLTISGLLTLFLGSLIISISISFVSLAFKK